MTITKLNENSKELLTKRCDLFKSADEFSIIFMGDTHIDINFSHREQYYSNLLHQIATSPLHNDVICIIHGGDGGDLGQFLNLQRFVDITNNKLKDTGIPLFLTIGNHDFDDNPIPLTSNFNSLISQRTVNVLDLKPQGIRVLQLDTSIGNKGLFTAESKKCLEEAAKYKSVQYFIDMHIPPEMNSWKGDKHTMSDICSKEFFSTLDLLYPNILAVITHHKHNFSREIYHVDGDRNKAIPLIMLGCAGYEKKDLYNYFLKITICKTTKKITQMSQHSVIN